MKYNVITLCSGYDSQCLALDELKKRHSDFDYDLKAWCEIDPYAIQMHDLIFPEYSERNLKDMTQVNWKEESEKENWGQIDILTYSTPCQDISQAGKQKGLQEGADTRSAIVWSTENAIRDLKPKFLLQENVKALVSKKFLPDFTAWQNRVASYGYRNYFTVLNARDFKVPLYRERVFMVSVREDVALEYEFPEPQPLEQTLGDILEEEVDESYFLKDDSVNKFLAGNNSDCAIFVQFGLNPTPEDAMFVKTWCEEMIEEFEGDFWSVEPEIAKTYIEKCKAEKFPEDWHNCVYLKNKKFKARFEKNME